MPFAGATEQRMRKLVAAVMRSGVQLPPALTCETSAIASVITRLPIVSPEVVAAVQVKIAAPVASVHVPTSIALIAVPVPTVSVLPLKDRLPVPVLNVPAPTCEKVTPEAVVMLPLIVTAPVPVVNAFAALIV